MNSPSSDHKIPQTDFGSSTLSSRSAFAGGKDASSFVGATSNDPAGQPPSGITQVGLCYLGRF